MKSQIKYLVLIILFIILYFGDDLVVESKKVCRKKQTGTLNPTKTASESTSTSSSSSSGSNGHIDEGTGSHKADDSSSGSSTKKPNNESTSTIKIDKRMVNGTPTPTATKSNKAAKTISNVMITGYGWQGNHYCVSL